MSSGDLQVKIRGCTFQGRFENGFLRQGITTSERMFKSGTFDDNTDLHGSDCELRCANHFSRGFFEHGKLIKGEMLILSGNIMCYGNFKNNKLTDGKIVADNYCKIGDFNNLDLTKGSIYSGSQVFSGVFLFEKMTSGKITQDDIKYEATFEIDKGELQKCEVNYSGDLHNLTDVQFKLYICSGKICKDIYSTYITHFNGYNINKIWILLNHITKNNHLLQPSYLAAISAMMDNLKKNSCTDFEKSLEFSISPVKLSE